MSFFDLIDNFNIGLGLFSIYFFVVLFSSIFYLFIIQSFVGITFKNLKNFKNIKFKSLFDIFYANKSRLSLSSIFLVCFSLFFYFTQLFITNQIKTMKVVVSNLKFELLKTISYLSLFFTRLIHQFLSKINMIYYILKS